MLWNLYTQFYGCIQKGSLGSHAATTQYRQFSLKTIVIRPPPPLCCAGSTIFLVRLTISKPSQNKSPFANFSRHQCAGGV